MFRPIKQPVEVQKESTPWASEYLESNKQDEGKAFKVTRVSFGQKGVLLETANFKAFFYRSSNWYSFLEEALTYWVKEGKPVDELSVLLDSKEKSKVIVGLNEGVLTNWTKKGENTFLSASHYQDITDGSPKKLPSNPLLVSKESNPSPSASVSNSSRTRKKKNQDSEGDGYEV